MTIFDKILLSSLLLGAILMLLWVVIDQPESFNFPIKNVPKKPVSTILKTSASKPT